MKRILTVMMTVMMCAGLLAGAFGMTAKAQETTGTDIGGMLGGVKDKLSEAIAGMDEGTVGEVLNFVKEKVSDGSLKTEDGLTQAIREGEEKFGVTVDRADAQKVVDTMEKLEDMGFSGEYVMEKAKELLRSTSMKTAEVAFAVGYKDAHYFSYLFKKTQECTPREFRSRT